MVKYHQNKKSSWKNAENLLISECSTVWLMHYSDKVGGEGSNPSIRTMNEKERKEYFQEFLDNNYLYQPKILSVKTETFGKNRKMECNLLLV